MNQSYFITGTSTDCGKTYVTTQLLSYFNAHFPRAQAIKPVVSGCHWESGVLISDDIEQLQQANPPPLQTISGWQFEPPISPHLAAAAVGEHLSARSIADFCQQLQFHQREYLFVEGAGGLMVPLNNEETWLDVLKITGMPVILVVGMQLGCINHALLTDQVLRHHGISCAGWIANCLNESMLLCDENISTLSSKMNMPHLATIPYNGCFNAFQFPDKYV